MCANTWRSELFCIARDSCIGHTSMIYLKKYNNISTESNKKKRAYLLATLTENTR